MSLTENLASQNAVADPVGQVSGGVTKGLDAGLAFAQAKQRSEEVGMNIESMKNQAEAQKSAYVIDQINKASQTDNKSLRKLYMDGADKSFQKFYGTPMSKDIKDFINNVPESSAGIQKLVEMYPAFASDPAQHAQFIGSFKSMFNSNLADAQKFASGIADQYNKLKASESAAKKADVMERRLDQGDRRLEGVEAGRAQAAIKNAQNSKTVTDAETQLLGSDKGLNIIQSGLDNYKKTGKTITWSQLHEVTTDLAGLTSAKLSAVIPVQRQHGIEKDIPAISSALGMIDREFNQAPSASVPVALLKSMEGQFKSIQKVLKIYHKEQVDKRLKSGVESGVLPKETADKFSPSIDQQQAPAATNDGAPVVTPAMASVKSFKSKYPNVKYEDLSPGVRAKVDKQTYDSL